MTEHLKVLGSLAALFHQGDLCRRLRQAECAEELYRIATAG